MWTGNWSMGMKSWSCERKSKLNLQRRGLFLKFQSCWTQTVLTWAITFSVLLSFLLHFSVPSVICRFHFHLICRLSLFILSYCVCRLLTLFGVLEKRKGNRKFKESDCSKGKKARQKRKQITMYFFRCYWQDFVHSFLAIFSLLLLSHFFIFLFVVPSLAVFPLFLLHSVVYFNWRFRAQSSAWQGDLHSSNTKDQ